MRQFHAKQIAEAKFIIPFLTISQDLKHVLILFTPFSFYYHAFYLKWFVQLLFIFLYPCKSQCHQNVLHVLRWLVLCVSEKI